MAIYQIALFLYSIEYLKINFFTLIMITKISIGASGWIIKLVSLCIITTS